MDLAGYISRIMTFIAVAVHFPVCFVLLLEIENRLKYVIYFRDCIV